MEGAADLTFSLSFSYLHVPGVGLQSWARCCVERESATRNGPAEDEAPGRADGAAQKAWGGNATAVLLPAWAFL